MVDVLTLRRETKISKLLQLVPYPKGSLPYLKLPGWESIPLNAKLPIMKAPEQDIVFSKNIVGNKIWHEHPSKDFAQYDPSLLHINFDYEPMHDPFLKYFFKEPIYEERILWHKLVDNQNGVVCDLKQFNRFRRYLFELYLVKVHQRLKEEHENEKDLLYIRKTEQNLRKSAELAFKKSLMRSRDDILAEKAEKRKQLLQNLLFKYERNIIKHAMNRRINYERTLFKSQRRLEHSLRRRKHLQEKERMRRIILTLRLQEKDKHHHQVRRQNLFYKQQEQKMKAHDTWNRRMVSRHNQQIANKLRIEANERQVKINIEKRQRKLEKAMQKMYENFMQYKAGQVRKRYKHYHKENLKEAMQKGIKLFLNKKRKLRRRKSKDKRIAENSFTSLKSKESFVKSTQLTTKDDRVVVISEPTQISISRDESEESFYSITKQKDLSFINERLQGMDPQEKAMREISNATINSAVDRAFDAFEYLNTIPVSMSIIEIAKQIIQTIIETPDSVLPFDDAVVKYAQNRVKSIMETVKCEVMEEIKILVQTKKKIPRTKSSITLTQSKSKRKSVGFSGKSTIEIDIGSASTLKPVRSRIPTPTTSLENLVSITLKAEPDEQPQIPNESNALELLHLSRTQKILMERNCMLFKHLLRRNVEQRCLAAIDFDSLLVIMKLNPDLIGVDYDYLIDLMAESVLRLPTEDLKFGSNLKLATNVLTLETLVEIRLFLHEARKKVKTSCCGLIKKTTSMSNEEDDQYKPNE